MIKTIYETNVSTAEFDDRDSELPIGIDGAWFTKDQALELAGAILATLGATVEPAPQDRNEATLKLAAEHSAVATFRYAKGNGTVIETRSVQPGEIQVIKGNKVVTGWDTDREDIRAFRLDRIAGNVALS